MEPGGVIGQFFEVAADRALDRRGAAQGEGRRADLERRSSGRPATAALWGKVQEVRDAISDFRRSGKPIVAYHRIRRRAGVLSRQRLRQGLPDADRVARPDRHGELRAVPARHARQDRRVSRHAAHRRLQDRVEHVHRAHLHAGAPRDGASRSTPTCTSSSFAASPTAGTRAKKEVRALIDHGPFLPEDAVRAGLVDDVAYEDELDDKVKLATGRGRSYLDRGGLPARVTPASLGLDRGPRIAVIYAVGVIASGQSSYDSPSRPGGRLGHDRSSTCARRAPTTRSGRSCCASTAPADRRSRRTSSGARCMLTRERQAGRSRRCPTSPRRAATTSPCRRTRSSRSPPR